MNPTAESPPGKGEGGANRELARPQIKYTTPSFSTRAATSVKYKYPDPHSVFGRVLGAHLAGHRLTVADSLRRFGHDRLADSEFKLRKLGWPIKAIRKSVTTSDGGRQASVAEYFLDSEAIAAAGKFGQQYAAECARINAERRAA